MIPYLFLIASGVCLMAMSLLRKEYDRRTSGDPTASFTFIGITYIAILAVAFIYFLVSGTLGGLAAIDGLTLLLGLGFALATFITTIICIVGASYGSVSIIVVFANLGTVTLSTFYGLVFDSERNAASLFTWLGLLLVLGIMVLNFTESTNEGREERSAKDKWIYKLLCFVVFFTNGIALVIYSILTKYRPSVSSWSFIALYSLMCVLLAVLCLFFLALRGRKRQGGAVRISVSRITLLLIGAYAVFFLIAELMSLANTTMIPIIIHAPLSFAIPVVILTVAESIIYKMPVTKSMIFKIFLALAGSVLFVL